ncbi:carbohydrate porin [Acinetobacter terrestris]|uniref:DcaP family trimeric outer membrane transporter n=1 Tax=Acinetobacter terrestris TaxID=2529843 RepID=UPI00103E49DF|nr:DcaP family trimeric outer membrane transporter [Acinetobacter terrestris]TCB48274.1 carbohydrate porin [Acinetobacter terrestris]
MKKLILAAACAAVTGTSFAETSTTEQRINVLEAELQRLKQEVSAQKNTHIQLVQQQQQLNTELKSASQKNIGSWMDNVDVYGILRLDGAVDFKDTTAARGRTSNQINKVPFDAAQGKRSDFTIAASRIGMDIKNLAGREDVKAKLEADFWVDNGKGDGKLRIRHAYVSFDDWLFGQTWSLMSNMETMTESIDYTQFLGVSTTRVPQVRRDFNFNAANKLQLALEYASDRSSELPALTAKYIYKNQAVLLMGQGFINEKRAEVDHRDIDKVSWGVGLGARYKFTPKQSVQANYYHVKGDQKFVSYTTVPQGSSSDGAAMGGDYSVDLNNNSLLLNEFDSLTLGYSHKFNDQWRGNIATSLMKFEDDSTYAKENVTNNKQLTDHAINLIYTPRPYVDLGVEYHLGERESFEGKTADISRVNLSAQYKF